MTGNTNKLLNPLFLIIGVPIIFIAIIALIIAFRASIFEKPKYDFVYLTTNWYGASNNFYVKDGRIQAFLDPDTAVRIINNEEEIRKWKKENRIDPKEVIKAEFYVFDVSKMTAVPISFKELKKLQLSPSPISPDGYAFVKPKSSLVMLPFVSVRDSGNYLLKKGMSVIKLPIYTGDNRRIEFIGWILNN